MNILALTNAYDLEFPGSIELHLMLAHKFHWSALLLYGTIITAIHTYCHDVGDFA